jgi:predicted metal-dependent phosphoesterase TrpH
VRADLHVHSNASDGTDPPAEVMSRAAQAGLDVVALTDHDTVAGHAQARRSLPGSLTLVPGMELSCRLDDPVRGQHSLHLLAYLFDPEDPELAAETRRIRDDRVLRARAMVDRLIGLGVPITWDDVAAIAGVAVIGRPHIARAIGLVRAAGGVAVVAHPRANSEGGRGGGWVVTDEQIAELAAAGLAGVEVCHPDQSEAEQARLLGLTRDLGLIATGGSDDHGSLTGHRIGSHTAPAGAYESLIAQATGSRPVRSD